MRGAQTSRLTTLVYQNVDPSLGGEDDEIKFQHLSSVYLFEHKRRFAKRGPSEQVVNRSPLDVDILPQIGNVIATKLSRKQVAQVVDSVSRRGALVHSDRVLGIIRAIYNWTNGTGKIECDPTKDLRKRNAGKPRQRYLSDSEIVEFWTYLGQSSLSVEISSVLKLQLLLGLMINEAIEARRNEISLERKDHPCSKKQVKPRAQDSYPSSGIRNSELSNRML